MRSCLAILSLAVVALPVTYPCAGAQASEKPPDNAVSHESLRVQLAEWLPPYHALLAEGQLVSVTPSTPLPKAVADVWQKLALSACAATRNDKVRFARARSEDARHDAWQKRFCAALEELAQTPSYGLVLSRTLAVQNAAEHLNDELKSAWALTHDGDHAVFASIEHHLAEASSVVRALSAAPLPVAHDLRASLHARQAQAELRLHWTAPGDANGAPAIVRAKVRQKPEAFEHNARALGQCAQRQSFGPLNGAPGAWQLIAELPRATTTLSHGFEQIHAGLEVMLCPVSAFGVEGAASVRPVQIAWPRLMPVVDIAAKPAAPALEQPEFYRNLDAIFVSWQCSPSETAAEGSAQLLRYDVFRTADTNHAIDTEPPAHFAAPFAHFSALGPFGALPNEREFVGSAQPNQCTIVDRPGAERLREGVRYVVAAVGLNEERAVAIAPCQTTPIIDHDVRPLLALARAGGDRLRHPTHFERERQQALDKASIKARKKLFLALPVSEQLREREAFWRAYPATQKRKWQDSLASLLTDEEKEQRLDTAIRTLPVAVRSWAELDALLVEHKELREQIAQFWRLLPLRERLEARLALERVKRREPLLVAIFGSTTRHGIAPERVYGWSVASDPEDVAHRASLWAQLGEEQQHQHLIDWARSLSAKAQRALAYPPLDALAPQVRERYLSEPPNAFFEALWPVFFAWQDFKSLSDTQKLELIGREVFWPARVGARLRYALRPLDIWLAFERASAIATWSLGVGLGWYAYSSLSSTRRRRPRAKQSEWPR